MYAEVGTKSGWDRRGRISKRRNGARWSGIVQGAQGDIPKAAMFWLKANFKGLGGEKDPQRV